MYSKPDSTSTLASRAEANHLCFSLQLRALEGADIGVYFTPRILIMRGNFSLICARARKAKKYVPEDLHSFLDEIGILIIAVPLTSLTHHLIKTRELELLGPDGLLVKMARGSIIDEKSLFNALRHKVIAGVAIDVWYNYDPMPDGEGRKYPFSYPFHELPNVILSPHRAASPLDDLTRWNEVIENIQRYAKGNKEVLNVVDLIREY